MTKHFFIFSLLSLFAFCVKAQTSTGTVQVIVIDRESKKPLFRAHAVAFQNNLQKGVGECDWNGLTLIKPLAPGKYLIKSVYKGYCVLEMHEVPVIAGQTTYVQLGLVTAAGHTYAKIEQVTYQAPIPYYSRGD